MLETVTFYGLAIVIIACATMVITARNPVHSALYLVGTLVAVAGIFLNLGAEFLTAVQILVYVGGIMVLFLFVVMLVSMERMIRVPKGIRHWKSSALLGVILAAELAIFFGRGFSEFQAKGVPVPEAFSGNTQQVGWGLYLKFMLPFEVASILLLVAIVGAVIYTRKHEVD